MLRVAARASFPRLVPCRSVHRRSLRVSTVMTKKDPQEVISDFRTHVNMSVKELQDFLKTKESKDVGWKPDGGESTGHESGRYICELIPKKDDDFTDDDLQHMTHVNAYCKRHLAQRPQKVEGSKWLYSLKNWYSLSVTLCEMSPLFAMELNHGSGLFAGVTIRPSDKWIMAIKSWRLLQFAATINNLFRASSKNDQVTSAQFMSCRLWHTCAHARIVEVCRLHNDYLCCKGQSAITRPNAVCQAQ